MSDENQDAKTELLGAAEPEPAPGPEPTPDPEQEPQPEPSPEPEPDPEAKGEPGDGYEQVDFKNDPPEKVEARFGRIYRQLKVQDDKLNQSDAALRQMAEDNHALMQRLSKQERAQTEAQTNAEIGNIQAQITAAAENGQYDEVARLTTYLTTKSADLAVSRAAPEPEPEAAPEPAPAIDPAAQREVNLWANETGDDGQYLRPWAVDGHPQQQEALSIGRQIFADPEWADRSLVSRLGEIERRMTPEKPKSKPSPAPVLSGEGDIRQPAPKPETTLSADQKRVAEMMFSSMPAKDAHRQYAEGMNMGNEVR